MRKYWESEQVEVRLNNAGKPSFYFSSREGWEEIGHEIMMSAESYNIGTKITLEEPIEPCTQHD